MSARRLILDSGVAASNAAFPLTPALSLRERANCFQSPLQSGAFGCIQARELQLGFVSGLTRSPLFPSPRGRGIKGGGERGTITRGIIVSEVFP